MKKITVAIIGAGLIGNKRAEALSRLPQYSLKYIYDIYTPAAEKFAQIQNCEVAASIEQILLDKKVDLVVLAIRHKDAAELAPKILQHKHLLIEKPLGRTRQEAQKIVDAANKHKKALFVGFNYHFYPHVKKAAEYVKKGNLGTIISSTFKIGHAAQPGYEKTWKMDKELCGGGVILDPGVHMMDMAFSILGKPKKITTQKNTLGWNAEVEDEAFLLFTFPNDSFSCHHYSLNLSRNTMFIELVGEKGIIRLSGRGGNYGDMKFAFIPRWHWLHGTQIVEFNFGVDDHSFYEEMAEISRKLSYQKASKNYESFLEVMTIFSNI